MNFKNIILVVPAILLLAACSNNECYENHSALPLASFYSMTTQRPVALQRVEIYGVDAPNDSILSPTQTISEAYLPFRIWEEETQYVFLYMGLVPEDAPEDLDLELVPRDTVTFRYTPREWFVSPACGAMYFYDMKSVEHTSVLIDSISCNNVITNQNSTNIKIFFRETVAP